jgi:hypothetical protein
VVSPPPEVIVFLFLRLLAESLNWSRGCTRCSLDDALVTTPMRRL